jgi:Holliday junction resolvase
VNFVCGHVGRFLAIRLPKHNIKLFFVFQLNKNQRSKIHISPRNLIEQASDFSIMERLSRPLDMNYFFGWNVDMKMKMSFIVS